MEEVCSGIHVICIGYARIAWRSIQSILNTRIEECFVST